MDDHQDTVIWDNLKSNISRKTDVNNSKLFTQDQVIKMMTAEKQQGKRVILHKLGLESEKEIQSFLATKKKSQIKTDGIEISISINLSNKN